MKFIKRLIENTIENIIEEYLLERRTLCSLADAVVPILHERAVDYLSRGFDVHVKDVLRPKVGPKEEYIIFESARPATLWFLIDLSEARDGDLFTIRTYIKLSGEGDYLLHDLYELDGVRAEPIATLSARFAPSCRLTITQGRGTSKEVRFEVFGRYEGK